MPFPAQVRDIVELKDVRVAGKLYLHDPVTGYVYEHCTGEAWPHEIIL